MKQRGGATLSPPPPPASPALNCRQLIHIQAQAGPFAGDRLGCICIEIVHLLRFGGTGFLLSGDRLLADRKPPSASCFLVLLTPSASGWSCARPCSDGWFSALKSSVASLKEFVWVLLLSSVCHPLLPWLPLASAWIGGGRVRPRPVFAAVLGVFVQPWVAPGVFSNSH